MIVWFFFFFFAYTVLLTTTKYVEIMNTRFISSFLSLSRGEGLKTIFPSLTKKLRKVTKLGLSLFFLCKIIRSILLYLPTCAGWMSLSLGRRKLESLSKYYFISLWCEVYAPIPVLCISWSMLKWVIDLSMWDEMWSSFGESNWMWIWRKLFAQTKIQKGYCVSFYCLLLFLFPHL